MSFDLLLAMVLAVVAISWILGLYLVIHMFTEEGAVLRISASPRLRGAHPPSTSAARCAVPLGLVPAVEDSLALRHSGLGASVATNTRARPSGDEVVRGLYAAHRARATSHPAFATSRRLSR